MTEIKYTRMIFKGNESFVTFIWGKIVAVIRIQSVSISLFYKGNLVSPFQVSSARLDGEQAPLERCRNVKHCCSELMQFSTRTYPLMFTVGEAVRSTCPLGDEGGREGQPKIFMIRNRGTVPGFNISQLMKSILRIEERERRELG